MANAILNLQVRFRSRLTATHLLAQLGQAAEGNHQFGNELMNVLAGLLSGSGPGEIISQIEDASALTKATATITGTHANVSNGDTITIGGRVLTVAASPANENEWAAGANDTADAVALAACINANSELKGILVATAATGVVTLTYWKSGREGNLVTLATSDATAFALSAARLGSGASTQSNAPTTYDFGGTG